MNNPIDKTKSYTNKDFQSSYAELLDAASSLTNKLNITNEASPEVMLIKLMAILSDKLNYSIDKQVLECFPGSVTQRKNARQLFNLIGYHMKWYQSNKVKVGFKLKKVPGVDYIDIPAFTQLQNAEKTIVYTTLSKVRLYSNDPDNIVYVDAIEGRTNSINASGDGVDLSNLDENYRIYFKETNVAENGIFVADHNSNVYDWERVDNVSSYPLGSKVFEFGLNNDETSCYIQFPTDVLNLSSSKALDINYILTNGSNGNILKNTLTSFVSSLVQDGVVYDDYIAITQPNDSSNGKDPETIEQAYKNSRFVVGTFDTLITKQDYYNYIRNLMNEYEPIISNLVVCDRADDINNCVDIHTLKNGNDVVFHDNGHLTPFDVVLYMLNHGSTFGDNFEVITDDTKIVELTSLIGDAKAINLNLVLPSATGETKYLFKAKFKIKGQIVTAEKLTQDEARVLEENIVTALKDRYDSTQLDFGKELDYNELIENILAIDSRIKTVALDQPTYTIYKVSKETTGPLTETAFGTTNDIEEMLARMVLNGSLPFYKFNNDLSFKFGEVGTLKKDCNQIETFFNIKLNKTDASDLELKGGEVISLTVPQYVVDIQYNIGCKVILGKVDESGASVSDYTANENRTLGSNEELRITFVDTDGVTKTNIYGPGTIFNCTNAITVSTETTLRTGDTLNIYKLNKNVLPEGQVLSQVHIESKSDLSSIEVGGLDFPEFELGVNDYIIYTNSATTEIVKLGSGTLLRPNNNSDTISLTNNAYESQENATTSLSKDLQVIAQDIITLNDGCSIRLKSDSSPASLAVCGTHDGVKLGANQTLIVGDTVGTTEISKNIAGESYRIRTRLDISYVGSKVARQKYLSGSSETTISANSNTYKRNEIYVKSSGDSDWNANSYPINTKSFFSFNKSAIIVGGGVQTLEQPIDIFTFDESSISATDVVVTQKDNQVSIKFNDTATIDVPFDFTDTTIKSYLIPMTISKESTNGVSVTLNSAAVSITQRTYDTSTTPATITPKPATNLDNGTYILQITPNSSYANKSLVISGGDGDLVILNKIMVATDYGDAIKQGTTGSAADAKVELIRQKMESIASNLVDSTNEIPFNFTYQPPKVDICENPIDANNWFDKNHLYNRFVIPMYDYPVKDENTGEIEYDLKVNRYSIKE